MKFANLGRYWLPILALCLFTTRCLYELAPLQLPWLGGWLYVALSAMIALVVARLILNRVWRRRQPDRLPPDLSPLLLLFVYVVWPPVDLVWALVLLIGSLLLLGQAHFLRNRPRAFDLALGLLVLALYLITLGDHVGQADTFEFQVVAPQLGIAHPTGYPLFIIIGKLFSLLPIGSMAWRVNLVAAVFATAAVWLIYRVIVLLTSDRLAAAIAALALAASAVFWSQSVVVEVYSLNAALVAGVVYLLLNLLLPYSTGQIHREGAKSAEKDLITSRPLRLRDSIFVRARNALNLTEHFRKTEARQAKDAVRAQFFLLAFLAGLAFSHHLTSVILIPPILLTLIFVRPRLSWKAWLGAGGLFLLGLTPWLFIYLRWPALHNGQWMTISEWLGWIFGQRFGGALNLALWNDPIRWGIVTRLVGEQFGTPLGMFAPVGWGLAALGLIVLIWQNWRAALILAGLFVGYFFYGLVYNVPDLDVFLIPAYMMVAVGLGVALAFVTKQAGKLTSRSALRPALYLLFTLLPLSLIAGNIGAINQRGVNANQEAWGRYVLSLPIPERAALLVDSEKIAPLYYLQVTEHLRPDLDILVLGDETLYRQELDRRLSAGQPVYLARFLPNLPYRLRSLGPLVEVAREPLREPGSIGQPLNAMFGDQIELLGTTVGSTQPVGPYRITLFWKALSATRPNYHVRLRLIDAQGQVWWEDTGAHPVGGYYPTGAWAQDEVVPDFHEIQTGADVPPGTYDLEVGLFTPFRDEGLPVAGKDWLRVAQVPLVPASAPPLAREVRLAYDQTVITSLDELGVVPPESPMNLRLNAIGASASSLTVLVRDQAAYTTITQTLQPGQNRVAFAAPESIGDYQVRLLTGQPARCHWLADLTTDCQLATLRVDGEALGDAINFEDQVLLTKAKIDRETVKPGETLKVDLTWRGLKTWPDDYTAFVHLVGPDGKVHGQMDQWPVEGTLPTSSWTAGQVVDDTVVVTLPPDAPSGKYQVEAGWYLLSTLRRLNVLDAASRASDDRVIVGEFVVP